MPKGNGTEGLRLRVRGSGRGLMRIARAGGKSSLGRGLLGLGIPVVTALIHDLKHPDGYLRPLIYKLMHRKPTIKVIDAQYTSLEDNKKEIEKK